MLADEGVNRRTRLTPGHFVTSAQVVVLTAGFVYTVRSQFDPMETAWSTGFSRYFRLLSC